MCEFCTRHGEGRKWYLNMQNYSRELLERDGRREYIAEFLNTFSVRTQPGINLIDWVSRTPLRRPAAIFLTSRQKASHFGQVIPIEEVSQVLKLAEGVIRLPCVCRMVSTGNRNARYCYGLTLDERLRGSLDDSFSLEILSPGEALSAIQKLDVEGLVHSVWTFKAPYIGGLCNCDQDCMAFRITHERGYFQNMFRGEDVAGVDLDACNGCRNCLRQCQYGALRYSATQKKVRVDPRACYGCGVCRAACHRKAIALHSRMKDPLAANIW